MRRAISGAAALDADVALRFERRYGIEIWQGYGLTEAAPAVSTSFGTGRNRPGSVGRPLPGVEVQLVDDEGEPVLEGDTGEIWVRGDNVFAGYWRDATPPPACATEDGWLHTGDIGVIGDDGDLFVVDRSKDLVIVSGFNVFPAEVERVVASVPGVAEVAVIGRPDPTTGETVEAVIVASPGASVTEEIVRRHCAANLARYKCPTKVRFVTELPRGLVGKALRTGTTAARARTRPDGAESSAALGGRRRLGARHLCLGTIRPMVVPSSRRIPEATVARLPVYQRILLELVRAGTTTVSSDQLAEMARVNASKVRKDLSFLGSFGTRGSGYEAQFLLTQIDRELGLHGDWPVAIVGLGNLGRALANSQGFTLAGLPGGRTVRRGAGVARKRDRRRAGASRRRIRAGVGGGPTFDRRHRHPGVRRPGRRQPDGAGGRGVGAQLRPPGPHRAPRGPVALRRPVDRAAGHELLPLAPRQPRDRPGLVSAPARRGTELGRARLNPPGDTGLAYGCADRHPGRGGIGPTEGRGVPLRVVRPRKELCKTLSVIVVGLEQHQVPLDVLERVAIAEDDLGKVVAGLRDRANLAEVVVLSTCMRTELYAVVERFHEGVTDLQEFLAGMAGTPGRGPRDTLDGVLRRRRDRAPLRGGGRSAFERARVRPRSWARCDAPSSGPRPSTPMGPCCRPCSAMPCRPGAMSGRRPPSPRARRRCHTWPSSWPPRGWGDRWPGVTLSWWVRARWEREWWTPSAVTATWPRSWWPTARWAGRRPSPPGWGATAWGSPGSATALATADVVFVSTGASLPVLDAGLLAPALAGALVGWGPAPLVVVDLGVPRNVDPAVAGISGIDLLDMDDLTEHAERAMEGRRAELSAAQDIVTQEVERYRAEERARGAAPVVSALRARVEELRRSELERHRAPVVGARRAGMAGGGLGRRVTCWPNCCTSRPWR